MASSRFAASRAALVAATTTSATSDASQKAA
jgi:hypothetical protein